MEKQERKQKFDYIEKEYSNIYDYLMGLEEISILRKTLLTNKAMLIADKYEAFVNKMLADNDKLTEQIQKKMRLTNILLIITFICAITLPWILVIPMGISIYNVLKLQKMEQQLISSEEWGKIIKKAKDIDTIVNNIGTFLDVKSEKQILNIHKSHENLEEVLNIDLANSYLEIYLTSEIDLENVLEMYPPTKGIMIKMLQEDLETSEDDIYKLLEMAKGKVSKESLERELKLTRKLGE